jgi:hypothetical protein
MSKVKLNYSSELMNNFLHADTISPQQKFEALQTSNGHSLLFAIGTDGVFNLVTEASGVSATGWSKTDLSSAQIKKDFKNQENVTCRTFEAGQSVQDGSLGLAMVVATSKSDHLYLCLENSNSDIAWTAGPKWIAYPYDCPNKRIQELKIVNVFFCEVSQGQQYIVVDILRDPADKANNITRFYIDPTSSKGHFWQRYDLPVDVEADRYSNSVGRLQNGFIDGIYTAGHSVKSGQIVFCPTVNIYGDGPPTPVRLNLPGGAIPSAMASVRNEDMSSNLYVTSGSSLYYFASSNQNDSAMGIRLIENSLFTGITRLFAYRTATLVYIWGLNQANQVFYITCPNEQVGSGNAWSHPIPVVSDVNLFSPYINIVNGGNSFFAVGDNTLYKMMQSPQTGIWATQTITLPATTAKPQSFSSYTTRLELKNEHNITLPSTEVLLSAATRSSFFINNLYQVLDATPIPVKTDATGSITIIESVDSLSGTQLTVSHSGTEVVVINPMEKPFKKLAALNSVEKLKNAMITSSNGSTKPLVMSGVSDSDLQAVAHSNQGLVMAYSQFSAPQQKPLLFTAAANGYVLEGFPDAIWAKAGDIFGWLESGVTSVITVIQDELSGIWNFVATIAGQAYRCVLDSIETVVNAVKWVYNAIKTAIEDLIKYLEFLFEWNDILTTHNVIKNVFTQYVQHSVDTLKTCKKDIPAMFSQLQKDINKWADIPGFNQTPNGTTSSGKSPEGINSAPANLGVHHFQANVSGSVSTIKPAGITEIIFKDLLELLEREEATVLGACNAIKTNIIDRFGELTLTQIIQKFAAIVADTLLQTAENILLLVVDVFIQLTSGLLNLLNETIEIPVLSWLYRELTGNNLSFLDLICLVAAIPATIVYKIGSGKAPFPKNSAFTKGLLAANNFAQVKSQFFTTQAPKQNGSKAGLLKDTPLIVDQDQLKTFSIVTSFFALTGGIVLIYTSNQEQQTKKIAVLSCVANIAYVSPNIVSLINAKTSKWYEQLNNVLTCISIVKGFINIGLEPVNGQMSRLQKASAGIECVINLLWNIPVSMNIDVNKAEVNDKYKSLVPESIGNYAFNLGGILEPLTRNKYVKVAQGLSMLTYGLCMPIAGGIYRWESNQEH